MPQFHELANAFPLLTGEAFEELVSDIRENGLTEPVVMLDGKILDGRNRWRACQDLGIPHREVKFADLKLGSDDPAAYVWSKNAVRRQLTPSQKAMAATRLVTAKTGDNRHTVDDKVTREKAAKMAGVGVRSIDRAKKVADKGAPEVIEAVESGTLALDPAEKIVDKPAEIQQQIMSGGPEEAAKVVAIERTRRKTVLPETSSTAPADIMSRQMEASSADGAKLRTRLWAENKDLIKGLDATARDRFVRELAEERRAVDQLLKLIKAETAPAATPRSVPSVTETKRAPAAKKTTAPRRTAKTGA